MAVRLRNVVSIFVLNQMFSPTLLTAKHLMNRTFSSGAIKKLVINDFGDPLKVVRLEEDSEVPPKSDQVQIKMLLAAINPADINTIQGVYPIKPSFPAVPGFEGVGEVIAVGPKVENLNVGDRVVPNMENAGTWRTHALFNESQLLKVPSDLNLYNLAGITVNPSTAYRMLKDFVSLKPGDAIVQNGANSAAGQNVIQLCKAWGIVSLNVVRDRPDLQKLKEYLESLGANHVITEDELRTSDIGKQLKPKLALNCVGGKNALNVLRLLDSGGVMVTYGGMSREPVTVPTSSFIFKDITLKGFWMTRWHAKNRNMPQQLEMFEELFSLIRKGQLKPPAHKRVPLSDFYVALENTLNKNMGIKGFAEAKYFLDFSL